MAKRTALEILRDYEARSLGHQAGSPIAVAGTDMWRGLAYRIGGYRLVSSFDEVAEILPMPAITPVPGAQPWMLGLANVRGNLLPVVDLKQFLEGVRTVSQEAQKILVIKQPGGDVGVMIDQLFGQRAFDLRHHADAEGKTEGRYTHFIDQVYRSQDAIWHRFSLDRLSRTPEFRQAAM